MTDGARELLMQAYEAAGNAIYQFPDKLSVRANGKWLPKTSLNELQRLGYAEGGSGHVFLTQSGRYEAQRLKAES